jgi:hypothetical protein
MSTRVFGNIPNATLRAQLQRSCRNRSQTDRLDDKSLSTFTTEKPVGTFFSDSNSIQRDPINMKTYNAQAIRIYRNLTNENIYPALNSSVRYKNLENVKPKAHNARS